MTDTEKNMATLRDLLVCFASWEPAVCVLGNVRAGDAFNAIGAAMDAITLTCRASSAAAVPDGALPPLPKGWKERMQEADAPNSAHYQTVYMEAEIAEWRARAAVEADRAQRPENANQPLCDSALRAEPAANESELARAWMMTHGYGNQTIVGALADLQARIDKKNSEGMALALRLMTAEERLSAATRCRAEGGDGAVINYGSPVDNSADRAQQGEPVAYAMMRNGKVEGVERTKACTEFWVDAEAVPLVFATKASAPADAPKWGRVDTVGGMVRNLLTLDQAAPLYTAFHLSVGGERRCKTSNVSISRERVIDGNWIDSSRKDVPYAHVIWAKPDERAAPVPDTGIPTNEDQA